MTFFALSLVEPTGLVAAGLVVGGAIGAAFGRMSGSPVSTGDVPRRRTGRLPLPDQVTALEEAGSPVFDRVNEFVDRLAELPLSQWVAIGRALATDAEFRAARSSARVILDATISDRALGVAAWYVKDAVETAVFFASAGATIPGADRAALAGAHGAAEAAALALLAEPSLSATDFLALYQPFAVDIPASLH